MLANGNVRVMYAGTMFKGSIYPMPSLLICLPARPLCGVQRNHCRIDAVLAFYLHVRVLFLFWQ